MVRQLLQVGLLLGQLLLELAQLLLLALADRVLLAGALASLEGVAVGGDVSVMRLSIGFLFRARCAMMGSWG